MPMIDVPGLSPEHDLPAGDARVKADAWLETLRADPTVGMAINAARMFGVGNVLDYLEAATAEQVETAVDEIIEQLARLKGD